MSSEDRGISTQGLVNVISERYTRRGFLKRTTLAGLSLPALSTLLAACADDDGGDSSGADAEDDDTASTGDSDDGEEETDDESPSEDDEDSEDGASSEEGESSSGPSGSIVISLANEPLSLDYDEATTAAGHPVLRNVYEALTNRDPETNEIVPELAESWERVDDLTWEFVLREGVTFHNGDELNAETAAYGLNLAFDPESGNSILVFMASQITAEALDDFTVQLTTEEPDPILPSRVYFAPLPSPTQMQEDPDSAIDNPVGTGPYRFVEWAQGQHIRLEANSDWWGRDGNDPYGEITIQDVEMQFRQESTVRASQITAGEAQLANLLTPEDCDAVGNCATAPSTESLFLRPDIMYPVLGDVRIREAIALAIDHQSLPESIYLGAEVASQIYGPATFGYNEELESYPYDLDRAAELVEEAAADGVPIDMPINVTTRDSVPGDSDFVQYVAEQLNQIGLTAQSEIIEDALFTEEVWRTGRDEVSEDRGWLAIIPHGNELMDASASFGRYFSCDTTVSDGTYCNDELEPRIQEVLQLAGDDREQAYAELSQEVYDQFVVIPLVHLPMNYGVAEELNWSPRLDAFMLVKQMSLS